MRRHAAFTLLEMLAVVLILGLVAGVVLPRVGITGRAVDDQAQHLADALEFARQRSVMTAVPHRVVLDLDGSAWWVEWQPGDAAEPPPPEPEAEDAGPVGRPPLDLSPPPARSTEFVPLPSTIGRREVLREAFFERVDTPEGPVDRERVNVHFERNGTADPAEIHLRGQDGSALVVEVRPLADAVRVFDAAL